MKSKLFALLLLAGGTMFAGPRVVVGVGFGYAPAPVAVYAAPPAPVVAYAPPSPGFGYSFVNGYWYPAGARWAWRPGAWVRPPYARASWVAPHYFGRRFYGGYWRR